MDTDAGGFVISRPKPIIVNNGYTQGLTLMSDLHIGAPQVDYKLIDKELKLAKENGDRILINGDIWDLILPKDHKRFTPSVLHPRLHGRTDVVNAAIDWAVEILSPYAHLIDMIGLGNHETSIEKFHSLDPLSILIHKLQEQLPAKNKDHQINYGGYTGFVDYRFRWNEGGKVEDDNRGGGRNRVVVYYHHGSGADAPVTKGTIDMARKGWVRADLVWMGHKHVRLSSHILQMSCPEVGVQPVFHDVRQVISGAYFDTYVGQAQDTIRKHGRRTNYAADAGFAPQGKGGARLLLTFVRHTAEGRRIRTFQMQVVQ